MTDNTASKPTSSSGTAFVTGASSGIGATYAKRLAARGFDLLLVARRVDRLEQLAEGLRASYGVHATVLPADLAQTDALERVVQSLERREDITLVLNNAGVASFGSVAAGDPHAMQAMTDVNVTALTRLSQAAITAFKQRNRGTLINLGSVLSFHSLPSSAAYSGSKAYVLNFTRGLQAEVQGTDVVVQFVGPGATATDIWEASGVPLSSFGPGKVMSVDDLVDAALAGLDSGERITLPSVENAELIADYDRARLKLFAASQNGQAASRYGIGT